MKRLFSHIGRCNCCGIKILLHGYDSQDRLNRIMRQRNICYECAYWQDIIDYPPEYLEVINNRCLRIHPVADKKDKTLILGGKGKMRYFMRPDKSLVQSNDIWTIGIIPDRFLNKFQPTVVEITLKAYRQLKRTTKICNARACLDRYHCFRYTTDLEKGESGPYNSIPPKWKVGDEHCKFFINRKDILNDESSVNQ